MGDASRFIIFEKEKGKALSEVKSFANETARQKVSDLTTDQAGRSFDSFSQSSGGHQTGGPRRAYSSEQDPKTHAVENFLREVSGFLEHGFASRLGDADLKAIMRFVLLAFIILPILPNDTYGPFEVLNPHEIWLMIVFIVGLNLSGYIVSKFVGNTAGGFSRSVSWPCWGIVNCWRDSAYASGSLSA